MLYVEVILCEHDFTENWRHQSQYTKLLFRVFHVRKNNKNTKSIVLLSYLVSKQIKISVHDILEKL